MFSVIEEKIAVPLIIILTLFVLGGIYYSVNLADREFEEAIEYAPIKNEKKDSTENWQTYRNEEFGFEVRYPEEWEVQTNEDGNSFSVLNPENSDIYLRIAPVNIGGMSAFDHGVGDEIMFAGRSALKNEIDNAIRIIDTSNIGWEELNAIHYNTGGNTELKQIFEQILSTFKFIQ